jgi:hypothetical protein
VGTVRDENGAGVPNAVVGVVPAGAPGDSGSPAGTLTDSAGRFSLYVTQGRYDLAAAAIGYLPEIVPGLDLTAPSLSGATVTQDVTLRRVVSAS